MVDRAERALHQRMAGRIQALVSRLVNISVIRTAAGCMIDWRKVTNGQSAVVGVMQIRSSVVLSSARVKSCGVQHHPVPLALALKFHVIWSMLEAYLAGIAFSNYHLGTKTVLVYNTILTERKAQSTFNIRQSLEPVARVSTHSVSDSGYLTLAQALLYC